MHSDHRRRYHIRPAAEVYPGDRISTDTTAIEAVDGDRDADARVDWEAVERDAGLVHHRRRPSQTELVFLTNRGRVAAGLDDWVLVVQERVDGTSRD